MELERASYIRSAKGILFTSWFEDKQLRRVADQFVELMSSIGKVLAIILLRSILILTLPISAWAAIYIQRMCAISSLRGWNKTFRREYKYGIFDHPYIEIRRHIQENPSYYGKIK